MYCPCVIFLSKIQVIYQLIFFKHTCFVDHELFSNKKGSDYGKLKHLALILHPPLIHTLSCNSLTSVNSFGAKKATLPLNPKIGFMDSWPVSATRLETMKRLQKTFIYAAGSFAFLSSH